MLGCTINPDILQDRRVVDDLKNYSLVIARESITYHALVTAGVNALLAPCPAFVMESENIFTDDTSGWLCNCIGFNIGFLAQGNEKYFDLLFENYDAAIQYLINETSYDVLLIPHVNWSYNYSDFGVLDTFYSKYKESSRVFFLEEHNAPQQKYLISRCKAFVSLRTHAVISGLSSHVPTIITGYKTKSKGIHADVYGDMPNLIADVQSLDNKYVIKDKLKRVLENAVEIQSFLNVRMPDYIQKLDTVVKSIESLKK